MYKNPEKRFERFGKYIKNQRKGLIIYMGVYTIGNGDLFKSPVIFS
jgi:hypothetical protein